jgi:hypothetical protein
MPNQPLQPFSPPDSLIPFLSTSVSQGIIVYIAFAIVFVFWGIYTLVAIYHWLKYSHASVIAIPAIVMHLGISFILIVYAISGVLFL